MISLQIWVAMDSEVSSEQTQVSTVSIVSSLPYEIRAYGKGEGLCVCMSVHVCLSM